MFKRILVPLDGSPQAEQAITVAARLARATDASIVFVRVALIPIESSRWRSPVVPADVVQHDIDAELDKVKTYLEGAAKLSTLAGLTIETHVPVGSVVAQQILFTAESLHADLIVMCSHGYTGFKRWALGSVAQKIARHSPMPVLVLREEGDIPTNDHPDALRSVRVLVALDGSPLAEAALAPAAHLSAALSAPAPGMLHLARVIPWPAMEDSGHSETDTAARAWAESDAHAYLERVEQRLREGELAGLNLLITRSVAVHADVAATLMRMAEKGADMEQVDGSAGCALIALATHGRGGLERWAVGSVAERVLGTTKLPLLIVRPASGGSTVQEQSEANAIRM